MEYKPLAIIRGVMNDFGDSEANHEWFFLIVDHQWRCCCSLCHTMAAFDTPTSLWGPMNPQIHGLVERQHLYRKPYFFMKSVEISYFPFNQRWGRHAYSTVELCATFNILGKLGRFKSVVNFTVPKYIPWGTWQVALRDSKTERFLLFPFLVEPWVQLDTWWNQHQISGII